MMQPISSTPYVAPLAQVPQPSYNAVKIDINNPAVNAPGNQQQQLQGQYAPVTNPYYQYPQNQVYQYSQAQPTIQPVMQPGYMPQINPTQQNIDMTLNNSDAAVKNAQALLEALAAQKAAQQATSQVQQQNINIPPQTKVPEPVITQPVKSDEKTVATPKVEQPAPINPQVDLNSFIARLTNPDYEVQAAAMEEIANMVKDEPQKATELLDEKVVKSLQDIIKADSSKLTGPTAQQVTARQKMLAGQKISDEETKLANTITPMEQSERNKSYAMYTMSIMEKLYGEEVKKLANTTVPLTELPGAVEIVEQLKDNPNPMVRTSAIEALSYIQQPAYKEDLKTLFQIAKNDQDKNVQDAAKVALSKLDAMTGEAPKTETPATKVEMKPQTATEQQKQAA